MGEFHTVERAAELLGASSATVRRWYHEGRFPGAVRLWEGGPIRIPAAVVAPGNENTPRPTGPVRGVSPDPRSRTAPHLMSGARSQTVGAIEAGQRVASAMTGITTRPARAVAVMVAPLASIVARHFPDRDGWCAACRWQFPCEDYVAARAGLDAADHIVAGAA